MGLIKEFKTFAMRGNVIDLAVGVIIGAAFNKIVTSAVNDLIMPPLGLILGKVDVKALFFALDGVSYESLEAAKKAQAPFIAYGSFLQTCVDFLILAFIIFLMVRQINKLNAKPAEAPAKPSTKECPHCATAIPIKANRCPHCTQAL